MSAAKTGSSEREVRERYGLLLVVLVASFGIQGIAPEGTVWRGVVTVLLGAASLIAFRAADMPARRFRIAAALVAAVVGAAIVALVAGDNRLAAAFTGVANALLVGLAPPSIVIGVVRSMRAHGAVTVAALYGALCLYLLLGMFFAFVYGAIDQIGGEPFFAGGIDATPAQLDLLQPHDAHDRRLRRPHRGEQPRPHALRDRGARRSDLPRDGGLGRGGEPRAAPPARPLTREIIPMG